MALTDEIGMDDRARLYGTLADAFCFPPTSETAAAVRHIAQGCGVPHPDELSLLEIEREFMDLLAVPNARYVAPYESAYRDRWQIPGPDAGPRPVGGLLMGESTMAVQQCFVDAGVRPSQDLPDHIANELRLVAHLWHVEARAESREAAEAARQRQRFVAEHLLLWIDDLGSRIAQSSGSGFYQSAVEAAHVLLRAESGPRPAEVLRDTSKVTPATEPMTRQDME